MLTWNTSGHPCFEISSMVFSISFCFSDWKYNFWFLNLYLAVFSNHRLVGFSEPSSENSSAQLSNFLFSNITINSCGHALYAVLFFCNSYFRSVTLWSTTKTHHRKINIRLKLECSILAVFTCNLNEYCVSWRESLTLNWNNCPLLWNFCPDLWSQSN